MSTAAVEPTRFTPASADVSAGALRRLYLFFWSPGALFTTLRTSPRVAVPLFIGCVLSVAVAIGMLPLVMSVASHSMPEGLPSAQVEAYSHQIAIAQKISLCFVPVVLLIKTLVSAFVLMMLTIVVVGDGGFKKIFAMLSYTNLIMMLQGGCALLVLKLRGIEQIARPGDLQVQLGVDLFIHAQSAALNSVLNAVNLFEMWYVFLLVIGIRCLFDCSKVKAAFIGITYWAMAIAIQVAMAVLGHNAATGPR